MAEIERRFIKACENEYFNDEYLCKLPNYYATTTGEHTAFGDTESNILKQCMWSTFKL